MIRVTDESGATTARYYSPELMCFINQDIVVGDISNSTSLNRYSYVNGNPVTNIDPFGLEAERLREQAISVLSDVSEWIDDNWVASLLLGDVATAVDIVLDILEGDYEGAVLKTVSLVGSAALGALTGGIAGKWATKLAAKAVKKVSGCILKGVVNGAIIGGITGAVGNGTQAAFQTFVETKGDVSATLTSFGKGALSGAAFGGIGGGILGGLTSNFCFVEGTLVLTRFGNKAIEDIQVGDYVLSADPETGDIAYKKVLNTFVNEADTLTHVTVDGETFTSTATHKIYVVDKGWISAGDLQINNYLMDSNGNLVPVENVETEVLENKVTVYNFEVEDYHTYFVGSGVLVKNENCGAGKKQSPDQKALHDLAEESARNAKNGNPISYEEAQILDEWAKEYNVPQHHPATVGSGQHFPGGGYMDHTHIYNTHVPYVYD